MSDDFAVCPNCGDRDASFRKTIRCDRNRNQILECKRCGEECIEKEIGWRHYEYC